MSYDIGQHTLEVISNSGRIGPVEIDNAHSLLEKPLHGIRV